MDDKDYGVGAQILRALQITQLRLLSNSLKKRVGFKRLRVGNCGNGPPYFLKGAAFKVFSSSRVGLKHKSANKICLRLVVHWLG